MRQRGFLYEKELSDAGFPILFDGRNIPKDQRQINYRHFLLLNCPATAAAYDAEIARRTPTATAGPSGGSALMVKNNGNNDTGDDVNKDGECPDPSEPA